MTAAESERTSMNGKPVFSVPSKTVINFKSGFGKKLLCDDMTFTTGTACAYSCSFCYVPSAMEKQKGWLHDHGVLGAHEDIIIRRQDAVKILERQLANAKRRDEPLVIYASPLVDVAANMELVRETVECCKIILAQTEWHIRLLSKSNLLPKIATALMEWADKTTTPTADKEDVKARIIYGVSTGTLDDNIAKVFEQGTPRVSKRIESLHWLQDNGFRTFGMVCPSLPQQDYTAFARDMAAAVRYELCEHVWAEVINLRGESFTRTIGCLRAGGFIDEAQLLETIASDPGEWEKHSRSTFLAHAAFCPHGKLRYLQYVNSKNSAWWKQQEQLGAVLL